MTIKRCPNGHQYVAENYSSCPYCDQGSLPSFPLTERIDSAAQRRQVQKLDSKGLPLTSSEYSGSGKDENRTQIAWDDAVFSIEPILGWLVCIEGADKGKDFRFGAQINSIGRSSDCKIQLNDQYLTRNASVAAIVYDGINRKFFLIKGDGMANELTYINGRPVLDHAELAPYDKIRIARTTLSFIPFCGEQFSWDMLDENQQEPK